MLTFYKYLFYRLCTSNLYEYLKKYFEISSPISTSVFIITVLMCLNTLFVFYIIEYFNILSINSAEINTIYALLYCFFLNLVNHLLFVHRKKYKYILNVYSKEPLDLKRKRGVVVIIYILFSIISPIIMSELIRSNDGL